MKITEKEINQLSQLDRIELKLDVEKHNKEFNSYSYTIMFITDFWLPLVIISLFTIYFGKLLSSSDYLRLLDLVIMFNVLFIKLIFIFVIIDIIVYLVAKKKLNKLYSKYFKENLIIKGGNDGNSKIQKTSRRSRRS